MRNAQKSCSRTVSTPSYSFYIIIIIHFVAFCLYSLRPNWLSFDGCMLLIWVYFARVCGVPLFSRLKGSLVIAHVAVRPWPKKKKEK